MTLKAIAYQSGLTPSAVRSGTYTLGSSGGLDPSAPPSGNFDLTRWKLTLPRGRRPTPTTDSLMNLENPGAAGACTTKNKNELWVAANFWDFYDSVTDSKDNIYYVHTGLTPKLYLNNGKLNSMAEYLYIFMFKASQSHYIQVQEIFVQNKQW